MSDIQTVRELLQDRNLKAVAKKTGIPYMTLYRIYSGDTSRPSYDTVKKLRDYLGLSND